MKHWIGVAVLLLGCGDDGPRGIGQDTRDSGGSETDTSGDSDVDAPDAADDAVDAADSAEDTAPPQPNACPDGSCESGSCRSGVCVDDPPAGSASHITDPTDNQETAEWPELGCVDQSLAPPAQSATTTLYGAVARFGKGRKTIGIHVDVLLAEGFDPSACEAEASADAKKNCYRSYGTPLASTVSIAAAPESVPGDCTRHEECPLGYQCYDPNELGGTCEEQFGIYEVSGVPLDTPLILRAYATENELQWHDTTLYNVWLHSEQAGDGRVQYDAQMVSEGQWILTTNSVGLPAISPDNGAIGGRVRDCHGARDSWPIADVRLGLAAPGRAFVYFNDLEDDTVPLIDRETTDILGRFAALDVPPGWNRIAGAARVDGQVVTIGGVPVYVAANSLSIVSWPGTQPYWRQR